MAGNQPGELLFIYFQLLPYEICRKVLMAVRAFGSRDDLTFVLEPRESVARIPGLELQLRLKPVELVNFHFGMTGVR